MDSEVVGGIRFLHQQDGVPEREFIQAVAAVLQGAAQRAYLARVEYSDTGTGAVALCLRATGSEESLAKAIGTVFSRMFGSSQHLDIVFLNNVQERQLERVCRPFFESAV
jgi:hypothetical protein